MSHPFSNFKPFTRQKSISTAASQHLPFWGMEAKATHFQDEKVTQIHVRQGEFGMAKKVPARPKAPLASQFGTNMPWVLLSCSVGLWGPQGISQVG